jgi:hypothetical protein
MIVKMTPGADVVSIRLTIDGIVDWVYLIVSPDHTYKGEGQTNTPIELPLGLPAALNLDPVEWTVHLANIASVDVPYTVLFEFVQAGKVLATWKKTGKVKAVDEVLLDNNRAVLYVGKVQ